MNQPLLGLDQALTPALRDAILTPLRAGVVPAQGLGYFQVGREAEISTLNRDVERLLQGGGAVRFIVGPYGSGKTFTRQLLRTNALSRGLVVISADLSPERRLHASSGSQARTLYAELMRSLATRARPQGQALGSVVERFILATLRQGHLQGQEAQQALLARLSPFEEYPGGFDFIEVIQHYWRGLEQGKLAWQKAALRWLRAEYPTLSEARKALPVHSIIDSGNLYGALKLWNEFVRLAGYPGMLVLLDEVATLTEISHSQSRLNNYNQLLTLINETWLGTAAGLGFMFFATPELLEHPKRGIAALPALQARLQENRFAQLGFTDVSGPVVRLQPLGELEIDRLLKHLRHIQALGQPGDYQLSDVELWNVLIACRKHFGSDYYANPRLTIKTFLDILALLEQNPTLSLQTLLQGLLQDLSRSQ